MTTVFEILLLVMVLCIGPSICPASIITFPSLSTDVHFILKDALPPKEMDPAEKHCKMADLVLCLGTR